MNVVLLWHMHQPWYPLRGEIAEPWVYLHALKDYADMAGHLESVPEARAVVNFVPILLEQIERYRIELDGFRGGGAPPTDLLLAQLVAGSIPAEREARQRLLGRCRLDAVHQRRFPKLESLMSFADPQRVDYLSDQFFWDMIVWYHLVWLGEHVRRDDARVKRLINKGSGFSPADRGELTDCIAEIFSNLVPRYRALAESGRVELAMSPWGHPIVPLLLDLASAREALPHLPMPVADRYPGGAERARWHFETGLESFRKHLGAAPRGCWPPEGAISRDTLALLSTLGFDWCASGHGVLTNSLAAASQKVSCTHLPFRTSATGTACFFRDDGLSDLIGFTYKDWDPDDAVANLVGHLENVDRHCARDDAVVMVAMDGENAWEHYPDNGYHFLRALYVSLAKHPRLTMTTPSAYLDAHGSAALELEHLVAGSWVYGTLNTWIGAPDKNRAWDLLVAAKRRFDSCSLTGGQRAECERLLGICEGSDWFWWLGEDQSHDAVARFESLFRSHLMELYQALGDLPPEELTVPLSRGSSHMPAATMRRGS